MSETWARIPDLLASHVLLSAAALALGLIITVPLAVTCARRPLLSRAALALTSLVQTVPALALLALFFPLLLWLHLPPLGFLPALLALSLYALLPILRNGVTGLQGLDPAVIEAADAVGMTGWQRLRLVEAPLVLPVLMAGVRTAAVWTIGAATLSTTVGQPSLGDPIFAGLQTQSWNLVLAGCVAAAGLALAADALLGIAERAVADRKRWLAVSALALLIGGIACARVTRITPARDSVVVGAKNFSEQFILARVIGARLERAGYHVSYREGLGSTVAYSALAAGEIDVYVDYSGTLWTASMKRSDVPSRAEIVRGVADWAQRTDAVRLLGTLGFENAYTFAMREDAAARLGITTLDDLARQAPTLALASDLEFLDRPEWQGVRRAYGLSFRSTQPYAPTFMYRALASGDADVISAFSSDGRIAADRLRVLADPRHAIPGYDAILLVAPGRANDRRFTAALTPLINAIPVEAMRTANWMIDRDADKRSPAQAARWLESRIGR